MVGVFYNGGILQIFIKGKWIPTVIHTDQSILPSTIHVSIPHRMEDISNTVYHMLQTDDVPPSLDPVKSSD
jgi:hypothetical protein